MINYVFISPLGWSSCVWSKVINQGRFEKGDYDIIEFLDNSLKEINVQNIDNVIEKKISNLSQNGCIVTSSYGTIVLLSYFYRKKKFFPNLVIIDGLDKVPNKKELYPLYKQERINYSTETDYYNEMLSEDEKNDSELLKILNHNLIKVDNGKYKPKLSPQNIFQYLSIYSDFNPINVLESIAPYMKNLKIFSNTEISIEYEYLEEEKHLLMLKEPDMILKSLQH